MFYRKNRNFIIILSLSFLFLVLMLSLNFMKNSKQSKNIKKAESELLTESGKNQYLKSNLEKNEEELKNKIDLKDKLDLAYLKSYDFENINDFISSFENLKARYLGFGKAVYKMDERENSLSIKMNYTSNYRTLRSFIYNVEKSYYFAEFSALNITREKENLRGAISIKAYFGVDPNEK